MENNGRTYSPIRSRRILPTAIAISILLLATLTLFVSRPVRAQAGGPVVLMGIDAEDCGPGGHGPISVYQAVAASMLLQVTNGGTGILVLGGTGFCITSWWNALGTGLVQPVTFASGAVAISAQSFAGFALIGIASDAFNTPGGLTNAENTALAGRAAGIAAHVNGGGGLLGFSNCALTSPYAYLGAVGAVTCGTVFQSDITPTAAGTAVGITNALDVCCWHDSYVTFPAFLQSLAFYPQLVGLPIAAIGGQQVIIAPAEPRTIGFWKNHPDDTDGLLPKTLGGHVVDDVDKASAIFDGAKAKNAHDMLAAQLLAAKLNVMNGVPSSCVTTAIDDADQILIDAGYTGPGSTTAPTKSDKGAVNDVKDLLDDFNNNGCP